MAENEHQTQAGSATRRDTDAPTPGNPFPTSDIAADTSDLPRLLAQARDRLADLLFEIDHIELQVNPRILQDYNVKIACFENDLLKAEIEARRAKRKLALAQAQVNRGQSVADQAIEEQLEGEFAEWEAQLNVHVQDYLDALSNRAASRAMNERDARELKRLHRTLIRRLHPDANAGHEEECERFFLIAQAAYEHGDLDLLRSVEAATGHLGKNRREPASESEAAVELELVETRISVAREKLESLKSSDPYLLGDKLDNPDWVADTVNELKARAEEHRRARDHYARRYQQLKEGSDE